MEMSERQFVSSLYQKYYGGKEKIEMPVTCLETGKGRCLICGFKRKLGTRGIAKGKCKKCRKGGV